MKISVIAPIHLLNYYATQSDNYHLALAHLVDNDLYADFYRNRSDKGDFVILDNSAHEFGIGSDVKQLIYCASKIGANEIILPDRLFFGDDTVERSLEASETIRRSTNNWYLLMGVPQGRTIEEWDWCLGKLLEMRVNTIGISKDYEVWPGGLLGRVESIRRKSEKVNIHMLGWGRDRNQLVELASRDYLRIRGVDSAKPLVYAAAGIDLSRGEVKYPRRSENFFFLENDGIDCQIAYHNIDIFRRIAHGEMFE